MAMRKKAIFVFPKSQSRIHKDKFYCSLFADKIKSPIVPSFSRVRGVQSLSTNNLWKKKLSHTIVNIGDVDFFTTTCRDAADCYFNLIISGNAYLKHIYNILYI